MAWQRDPQTGEWVMVDAMVPDPMTQSTTGAEPDPALRDAPAVPTDNADGYTNPGLRMIPSSPERAGYDNEDRAGQAAWVEAAKDRGNIVRFTPHGVFEVDPNTKEIISQCPPMYRMN